MKRSIFFALAAMAGLLVLLLALDVINFETDQSDGRAVMIGIGCIVGLAALGFSGSQDEESDTGRAVAARKLGEGRIDPADLPSKPGSLLKQTASPINVPAIDALLADELLADELLADGSVDDDELTAQPVEEATSAVVAIAAPVIDPVDAELQSLIDEDQMYEINQLVEAADEPLDPDSVNDRSEIVPGSESVEPLARLELHLADYNDEDLQRVVKESESVVIAEMVRTGQLTTEGKLTEKDVASMVFLAYTSDEMLTELRLRKSLNHQTPDPRSLDQQVLDQPARDQ